MPIQRMCGLALSLAIFSSLPATTVTILSFDEVVERSSEIVYGKVVRSWASWDPEYTAIWTHYEIRIHDALKGRASDVITISEPGGQLDGKQMQVVGAPRYEVGEETVVFASPTPIGYLRTCGWEQGKFSVQATADAPSGRVVRATAFGAALVPSAKPPFPSAQSLAAFDGADLGVFLGRVRAELAAQAARGVR